MALYSELFARSDTVSGDLEASKCLFHVCVNLTILSD